MALDQTVVVNGDRSQVLDRCNAAMVAAGFKKVTVDATQFQISGRYRTAATAGKLDVALRTTGADTEVVMHAAGAKDNIAALFRDPSERIIQAFKDHLKPA